MTARENDGLERIPARGIATFQDCHFEDGHCYWYSVQSPEKGELTWSLVTPENDLDNKVLPSYNQSGSFVYVIPFSVQSRWTSQLLRSVDFPALPVGDGLCAVRFQYWLSGDATLTVHLLELGTSTPRLLWSSPGSVSTAAVWHRVAVTVNSQSVRSSYVLQISASAPSSYIKSAAALANITLTPDCFGQDVHLTTCGAEGSAGPTPDMCDAEYKGTHDATVVTQPPLVGAQVWTVPTSTKYSLQAYGARGGRDKEKTDSALTYGAHVQANFRLNSGDKLYVIVGQRGEDSEKTGAARSSPSGGGGGGATFVYRWSEGHDPELLILAGGGAGMDYVSFADDYNHTAAALWPGQWESSKNIQWTALSNETDFSGLGCTPSDTVLLALGGFGAGLGACQLEGGHGGGANLSSYTGSEIESTGYPGSVYVHPDNLFASFTLRSHAGQGRLDVQMVDWRCPCDFLCVWERPELLDRAEVKVMQEGVFRCVCPSGRHLAVDGLSCLASDVAQLSSATAQAEVDPGTGGVKPSADYGMFTGRARSQMPWEAAVVVSIVVVFILVLVVVGFFIYVMRSGPQERMWSLRMVLTRCLRNRSQSLPLTALPTTAMPARVMQTNPNYSFITSKLPEQKLPEIPRDNLRMSTQLGHGAFGEVYKAFLSGMSGTEREVAVAVKTLPPLCSEQTELDFFMEAFIVSKFHHPNIVQFLGVCFDQHPRYIVLELLDGGNLKSFLRESRPSQGQMSKVNVGDLIALAKDVCCGCCYLEEHHFIHRDIAARNCLLTSKGPERVAKIADFGMSRDVYRADYYKKEGRALLPLKWMPPEAFMEGIFTAKTDVWSYGVVLWEIFAMGYMPYPALSNTEVMNFIYIGGRLDCPEGCPPAVYDLMQSCWKQKSEERPSFAFIMQTLETIFQDTATMSQHLPAFRLPHLYTGCNNGRSNLKLLNHPVPDLGLHVHLDSFPNNANAESLCTEPLLLKTAASPYKQHHHQHQHHPASCQLLTASNGNNVRSKSAVDIDFTPIKRPLSVDTGSIGTGGGGAGGGGGGGGGGGSHTFWSCSASEPLLPQVVCLTYSHDSLESETGLFREMVKGGGGVRGDHAVHQPEVCCDCDQPREDEYSLSSATERESNVLLEKESRAGVQRVKLSPLGPKYGDRVVSVSSLETLEENDESLNDEQNDTNSI